MRPWGRSRQRQSRSNVAALLGACQAHGALQVLRVMQLHIDADVLRDTPNEELSLLVRRESASVRHAGLESLLIGSDVGREWQTSQLG